MSETMPSTEPIRLAIFTSVLTGGGIQRSMRDLALALVDHGYQVDLLVCHGDRDTEAELHKAGIRCLALKRSIPIVGRLLALRADSDAWRPLMRPVLLPLKSSTKLRYLAALRDYLRDEPPTALVAAGTNCNLVAILAKHLTQARTQIAVTQRNMLSSLIVNGGRKWRWQYVAPLIAHLYPQADAVSAVSRAAADDLARICNMSSDKVATVFNPTVTSNLRTGRQQTVDHPWFQNKDRPIILSVGRLVKQKDHATLLHAFAHVRATTSARLVVVGDGPLRDSLKNNLKRSV